MPQMKPMNWIFLFIFMNFILLLMNIINFYFKKINFVKLNLINNNKNFKNWKW